MQLLFSITTNHSNNCALTKDRNCLQNLKLTFQKGLLAWTKCIMWGCCQKQSFFKSLKLRFMKNRSANSPCTKTIFYVCKSKRYFQRHDSYIFWGKTSMGSTHQICALLRSSSKSNSLYLETFGGDIFHNIQKLPCSFFNIHISLLQRNKLTLEICSPSYCFWFGLRAFLFFGRSVCGSDLQTLKRDHAFNTVIKIWI